MLYDPDTKNFLIFLKKVLQNTKTYDIISKSRETRVLTGQKKKVATVAQSVERRIGSAEVTGPIPVSSLIKRMLESFKIKIPAFFMFIYLGSSRGRLVNAVVAEAGSFDFYKSK